MRSLAWWCAMGLGFAASAVQAQASATELPPTAAQPAPAESYDQTIRRAVQEYSLNHWAEAKVLFAAAHARNPNARALRGLALTSYESRQYVDAIEYFEQALVHEVQPLTPEMRSDAERFLGLAQQFVSSLRATHEPGNAELMVDGLRPRWRRDGLILLDPGPHEVKVSAPGFQAEVRQVAAHGGNTVELHVALVPTPGQALAAPDSQPLTAAAVLHPPADDDPPEAPVAATTPPPPEAASIVPWIVVAGGGALAITGGVLFGAALAHKSRVEHPERAPNWRSYDDSLSTGRTLFPLGAVLFGVGLAGVGAGLAWKLFDTREDASVHAILTPGYLGVAGRL